MDSQTIKSYNRIQSLLINGEVDEAISEARNFQINNPTSPQANAILGRSLEKKGHIEDAINAYKKTVQLEPRYAEIWHFLGNLMMSKGERKQAKEYYQNYLNYDPFRNEVIRMQSALKNQQIAEAQKISIQILDQQSDHPQAILAIANIYNKVGAHELAAELLEHGTEYSPFNFLLWFELTKTLAMLGKHQQRIDAAKKTVEIEPDIIQSNALLGDALAKGGYYEEALKIYNQGLQKDPNCANTLLQVGHILKTLGRREECEQTYRKCLKFNSYNGAAYWALADLKNTIFNDEDIQNMLDIMNNDDHSPAQKSQISFTLGKYFEDRENFEKAFSYYQKANTLKPNVNFNPQTFNNRIKFLSNIFSEKLLNSQTSEALLPTPIFIVGLPRAGSTLVEQILASHSQIEGTQELDNLPIILKSLDNKFRREGTDLMTTISSLDNDERAKLGKLYLDDTAIYRNGANYFIDKLPINFYHIGLIHMILPNAIIIDVRRHPLDNGFSAFKQHFAAGNDFSFSLENIGKYYNTYLSIMDHWNNVLPGKVYLLKYENLIANTEDQVKKLLEHCGLDFEQSCLNFHKNKRAVHTPSSEQVRQPINNKNINYWRNFEKQLSPLIKSLGSETLSKF